MRALAIGLASGLGNCVMMLPAIKALKSMGHRITLYVQTDFPTADLWRRCAYADDVLESPALLNGQRLICGNWIPASWRHVPDVKQYRLPQIHASEWRSNLRAAEAMGWHGAVDVSDWCKDLQRTRHWDVGIVPGCKGGTWLRKRYPGMAEVARHFLSAGKSVAVFGLKGDGVDEIPGVYLSAGISCLPDYLAACRAVIGTESGVTHLASSLGVPTVMLYTATSERKSEPVCKPNRIVHLSMPCRPCVSTSHWNACRDWKCREIPVERVIAAAEELFS